MMKNQNESKDHLMMKIKNSKNHEMMRLTIQIGEKITTKTKTETMMVKEKEISQEKNLEIETKDFLKNQDKEITMNFDQKKDSEIELLKNPDKTDSKMREMKMKISKENYSAKDLNIEPMTHLKIKDLETTETKNHSKNPNKTNSIMIITMKIEIFQKKDLETTIETKNRLKIKIDLEIETRNSQSHNLRSEISQKKDLAITIEIPKTHLKNLNKKTSFQGTNSTTIETKILKNHNHPSEKEMKLRMITFSQEKDLITTKITTTETKNSKNQDNSNKFL